MQFFAVVLALAALAAAAPRHHRGHRSRQECSASGNTQVCCDGALNCFATAFADNCENKAYCCDGGHSTGLLINLSTLNCVDLE
ncbi:hypothetical protein HIM_09236 [Hirsutella minnesotensis 3608]|uniref:Extracellular membrane protein CFEM domain-containing protein n=1 Tax=Hirsutella minnesotensis 3608 TaxID=1043627 RepID=A0A0F7ZSH1_9HYPO|nr:hypothetical protein HIM_09236 [Hirsutella minnesotensis 3608]